MPSILSSRASSAMRSISEDLLVMYGSSVTMIRLRPRSISSRWARAWMVTWPRPVL